MSSSTRNGTHKPRGRTHPPRPTVPVGATNHQRSQRVTGRRTKRRRLSVGMKVALITGAAVLALAAIFIVNSTQGTGGSAAGAFPFQVGNPGPGQKAPPIVLASTSGGTFNLAAQRGKTVLVFFQEGIGCEPCWTNMQDIERNWSKFKTLGIDEMVAVTTNSLDQLRQKVADENLRTPVLADPTMDVSKIYGANQYGMMGDAADGHTYMVIGRNGVIKWRADYGGPPNYTMYVPISRLADDIKRGLDATST